MDFTQRLFILSGIAGYRLPVSAPDFDLSATAGFRYQQVTLDTTISSIVLPLACSEAGTKDWLDLIFGLTQTMTRAVGRFRNLLSEAP